MFFLFISIHQASVCKFAIINAVTESSYPITVMTRVARAWLTPAHMSLHVPSPGIAGPLPPPPSPGYKS